MSRMASQEKHRDLEQAASILLVDCMGLRKGESCLIICDPSRKSLGQAVYGAAEKITTRVNLTLVEAPGPESWQPETLT